MLNLIVKFIVAIMLSFNAYLVVSNLLGTKQKMNIKTIVLLMIIAILTTFSHGIEYKMVLSIVIMIVSILSYKVIFQLSFSQSTIITIIELIIISCCDLIISTIFILFVDVETLRGEWYAMLPANILVIAMSNLISHIRMFQQRCQSIIKNIENKNYIATIIFLFLTLIIVSSLFYNLALHYNFSFEFIVNFVAMLVFFILSFIYLQEKNNYDKLNGEYDTLFNYVQTFEDWIEDEQLNRHELKNSLAVIRGLTKNKKIIEKIDEILQNSIKIEKKWIEQLKAIPKGGLKGLLYYKMAIAKNKNVDVVVDISNKVTPELPKLSSSELKSLFQLIGIYFDNAIEAASESNKKIVSLEIYLLKDELNIVISNTFVKIENLPNIDKKGVTTKGKGHGNGRYFAQKIVNRSKTMTTQTNVIDKYFVQKIAISI